ncbi:hypothetical protein DPMN_149080 [Dreissena polymorpha]|uniref:Uncharacterized protein n=1 Tax=Dreissena polymorpha TaxID=45954 RepID=A0A9D4FFA0_DREPO|nr:hypothetical protein DPMN_149080 [Dreissena polymorpha]
MSQADLNDKMAREDFNPEPMGKNRATTGYELHTTESVEIDRTHASTNPAQHSKASPGLEP